MAVLCAAALAGCKPEIGSEQWCEQMKEKSSADWTAREAKDWQRADQLRDEPGRTPGFDNA